MTIALLENKDASRPIRVPLFIRLAGAGLVVVVVVVVVVAVAGGSAARGTLVTEATGVLVVFNGAGLVGVEDRLEDMLRKGFGSLSKENECSGEDSGCVVAGLMAS